MIPNHPRFIEAIHARKKVSVRFYSAADSGVVERICVPLDYGPGGTIDDGLNRYWLWDCATAPGSSMLGLVPDQIVDLQVLGQTFNPAELVGTPACWAIPREWGTSRLRTETPPALTSRDPKLDI